MLEIIRDAWRRDRRGICTILLLNILSSLTGGISIVMLIPMLELLNVSSGGTIVPSFFVTFLGRMSYEWRLVLLMSIFILLIVGKAFLSRMLTLKSTEFSESYAASLRARLYDAISTVSWDKLTADKQSDTISLFTSQAYQLTSGVSSIISLASSLVSALIQLLVALWLSVPVTLLVLVFGSIFVFAFRGMFKQSRAYGKEFIRINREMYSELINQLWGVKEVRTYGVQSEHARLFHKINDETRDTQLRFARLQERPSLAFQLASSALVSAIFLISVLVLHMEVGRMMVLVYVFTRLWPIFTGLYSRIQGIQTCVPAYKELSGAFERFSGGEPIEQSRHSIPFERELRFEHVRFTYQGGTEAVLSDVSFTIPKGTITALIGRNGAGKTTIADLMLGLLQPDSGTISVDGVPLTHDMLCAWRKDLAYVPQNPWILNTTVRENLTRFHPHASEEELIQALKRAGTWELIERLPQGMDTPLGDRGTRLSGGERQRIVLARMLIGKPRFIVMDEATGAMDFENESAVRRIVRELCPESTVLIIAHRAETIRTAQYALVLEHGYISEQGEMCRLLENSESYLSKMLA